jgi:hypothetical protein
MITPSGGIPSGSAGVPVTRPNSVGDAASGRASVTVATYPSYEAAQRAIDYLSDQNFPVEHTAIVGTDLRLVEKVLGRLTVGRAAAAGAGGGAWFGLFIGLLFGIFSTYNWFAVVATGLVAGAIWGAIFGAVAHAATRGRRDFTSASSLQAREYAITVDPEHAEPARQLLARLNWQSSQAG